MARLTFLILILFSLDASADDSPARVGELSSRQMARVRERVEVLKLWSFSFGPAGAANMNNDHLMYELTLARHWETNENAEIRANLHTTIPSQGMASFTSFGIGGSWLLSRYDISPIVGAEFGYGYAMIPRETDKSGFSVGGHAGVRFFRTAAAQMGLEAYLKSILSGGAMPVDYGLALSVLY